MTTKMTCKNCKMTPVDGAPSFGTNFLRKEQMLAKEKELEFTGVVSEYILRGWV